MATLCGLKGDETELNLSGKMNGAADALVLADEIKDMGSLSSANLLGNRIGVEQAQALLKIKEAKPGLTTLCGLSGDETELDLSGKGLSAGCAILLAPEIEANGSLVSLNLAENYLGVEGAKQVAKVLPKW
jgi:Ran GTPase-activating protein (RanGAP) involved in mRNA processing and transport